MQSMLDPKEKIVTDACEFFLPVEKPEIPDRIYEKAKGFGMIEKPEFHISVLVGMNATAFQEFTQSENDLLKRAKEFFGTFGWSYSLTKEYVVQERTYKEEERVDFLGKNYPAHTRKTIVQKVDLPDLALFYKGLKDKWGIVLTLPVPHITLFSWADYEPLMTRGIGVSSQEDFDNYTRETL